MNGSPGFTIHATKKLLDRVKQPVGEPVEPVEPASALGNWYATALFWKPPVALFVNEMTFLPVFVPLAPATELGERFPGELRRVLDAHGLDPRFADGEIRAMGEGRFARTASRSVLGVMNEFAFLGRVHRERHGEDTDLVALSVRLSETPTSPPLQAPHQPRQRAAGPWWRRQWVTDRDRRRGATCGSRSGRHGAGSLRSL